MITLSPSVYSLNLNENDLYIMKLSDQHNMECINDSDNLVKIFSGFSGSLAILFITKHKKYIMTDSRYYLQVELELGNDWELLKFTRDWPTMIANLFGNMNAIYNANTISLQFYLKLKTCITNLGSDSDLYIESKLPKIKNAKELERANFNEKLLQKVNIEQVNLFMEKKLIKPINYNQLEASNLSDFIFELSEKVTGESTRDKTNKIFGIMDKNNIENLLISDLNDIAWLLNIRAFSYEFNPVPKCYLLFSNKTENSIHLFLDEIKPYKHPLYLVLPTSCLKAQTDNLKHLSIDSNTLSMRIVNSLSKPSLETEFYKQINILKCIKNTHEISVLKKVHVIDSLTIIKFWKHFELENKTSTEKELSEKLEYFRKQNMYYLLPSFSSIIAKGSNASIVHYNPYSKFAPKPAENTALEIDLTLCDIGGQYINGGTTDVTRVFIKPSRIDNLQNSKHKDLECIKKAYTSLLKAKFALFDEKVVKGIIKGVKFHEVVSNKMKDLGYTYGHGTGHGIGNLGAVHEGPVGLYGEEELPNSIVTSVEPGYYETGNFGLRLEDAVYTEKKKDYIKFNILTQVPYEKTLIDKNMLDKWELEQLNEYHKNVESNLIEYINNEESLKEEKKDLIAFIHEKCKEL